MAAHHRHSRWVQRSAACVLCFAWFWSSGLAWPQQQCREDIDRTGFVDYSDVALVLLGYGDCPEPAAPQLASIQPAYGSVVGGTTVVLRGAGLSHVERVTFGGVEATSVVPLGDSAVCLVSPQGQFGLVDVRVVTPQGEATLVGGFEFGSGDSSIVRSGPVVFGSIRASRLLQELVDGSNSLDIVVVGDSSTGNAQVGMWGYHGGFSQALHELGLPCYGLPVLPVMTGRGSSAGSTGGWNCSAYLHPAGGALLHGNQSGVATAYAAWSPGSEWVRYGSVSAVPPNTEDWAYIPTGSYSNNYNAIDLWATHPLNDPALELWHRIRFGTFEQPGGFFQARVRAYDGTPVHAVGPVQGTEADVASFRVHEYPFRVSTPIEKVGASWSGGPAGAQGPCAIHSHSIYCRRKGWSVTSHGYLAGYSSKRIREVLLGVGATPLRLQLQELRERQRAAGGGGRVLVLATSGINGVETPEDWVSCHGTLHDLYQSAWQDLGYPDEDFAMVSFVSVPANAADNSLAGAGGNLMAVREAARDLALVLPGFTVVDAKTIMPFGRAMIGVGNGRSYFRRTGNLPNPGPDDTAHLSGGELPSSARDSSDGYTIVSHEIIRALLSAR